MLTKAAPSTQCINCAMNIHVQILGEKVSQNLPDLGAGHSGSHHNAQHVYLVFMAVYLIRRDLLKLIDVREFSLEATFQDPCQSFILPEVGG